jgi:hypothetical protein
MLEPQRFSRRALPLAALISVFASTLGLGGCASLASLRRPASVTVAPSDRLFLEVAPFDSAALADLGAAGIEPQRMRDELDAEIRYQLVLRGQEEARIPGDATVRVKLSVRRLMPGAGNTGTFASFGLVAARGNSVDSVAWEWRARPGDNVPDAYSVRHLARAAATQALARMQARPVKREPPPPLMLL